MRVCVRACVRARVCVFAYLCVIVACGHAFAFAHRMWVRAYLQPV